MRFADMFPGTYLKAADFDGGPKTLTIASIAMEDIGQNEIKPVLHFFETQQGLVLNKTNGNSLAENPNFGGETDNWVNKQVIVQAERTTFQGKPVMGIRVYPAPMQPAAAPAYPGAAPGPVAAPAAPAAPGVPGAAPGVPGAPGAAPGVSGAPGAAPGVSGAAPGVPGAPPAWSQ